MNVIVYQGKGFKEPWFLLVPAGEEDILSTEIAGKLSRGRMNIEVTFRDFKSHLGVLTISLFAISSCLFLIRDNLFSILIECFNWLEREKVFMFPSFGCDS